jgi:hypothetical protein
MTNLELTEMWQDGEFNQVTSHILDSKEFMQKDRLIDFCVYFSKYLGFKELQVLQKLI